MKTLPLPLVLLISDKLRCSSSTFKKILTRHAYPNAMSGWIIYFTENCWIKDIQDSLRLESKIPAYSQMVRECGSMEAG
jgi:hypothetical protein